MAFEDVLVELHGTAKRFGVRVDNVGNGRWLIRSSVLTVRYQPKKRVAHILFTRHTFFGVSVEEACLHALRPPPLVSKPVRRNGSSAFRISQLPHQTTCRWCGAKLSIETSTVDHIIPVSRGGLNVNGNRVLSCIPCNNRRGSNMPELNPGYVKPKPVKRLPQNPKHPESPKLRGLKMKPKGKTEEFPNTLGRLQRVKKGAGTGRRKKDPRPRVEPPPLTRADWDVGPIESGGESERPMCRLLDYSRFKHKALLWKKR